MLCSDVQCLAVMVIVLCSDVKCLAVKCRGAERCEMLDSNTLCSIVKGCALLFSVVQCCAVMFSVVQYCAVLCSVVK